MEFDMKKTLFITILSMFSLSSAYAVNCQSFGTQAEAQVYFNVNHAKKLDRDHDGIACEHLPDGRASKTIKSTKSTKTAKRHTKATSNVIEAENPFTK